MTVTTSRRRLGALALCVSLLAVVVSACGGGGSDEADSGGGTKTATLRDENPAFLQVGFFRQTSELPVLFICFQS